MFDALISAESRFVQPILASTVARVRSLSPSVLVSACLVLLIVPVASIAQTKPLPPQSLCIEESANCGQDNDDNSSNPAGKKWNPGHYLKVQGNSAQADREDYFSSVTRSFAKLDDSALLRGAQVKYAWGMLEPSLGVYDWETVYRHLEYLSARGKKMILTIDTKCFSSDCTNLAPRDLTGEVFRTSRETPTQIIEIWEAKNMDLFIRFWRALGAEFDSNPDVEMIIGSESTASLAGDAPAGFSKAEYAQQLRRMYTAQASAFDSTNIVAMVNFLSDEVSNLVEHAYTEGAGRGMPDVGDSDGTVIFRGDCVDKECGERDYRELVPHFGLISYSTLNGGHGTATDTPPEIIDFGMANRITHYSWISSGKNEDSWDNVIFEIESRVRTVHTACPRAYTNGCQ